MRCVQMLRAYASELGSDWHLAVGKLEYAYNDSVHEATGYTPFELEFGQHPHAASARHDAGLGDRARRPQRGGGGGVAPSTRGRARRGRRAPGGRGTTSARWPVKNAPSAIHGGQRP